MPDTFDPAKRSWIMAQVKGRNTAPEMAVRRAVHSAGYRYRLHRADLPGKPDIVFPRFRLVVFVHGCFWHWHGCKRSRMPMTNRAYWKKKIGRNVERDSRNAEALRQLGWAVVVLWECDLHGATAALIEQLAKFRIEADGRS